MGFADFLLTRWGGEFVHFGASIDAGAFACGLSGARLFGSGRFKRFKFGEFDIAEELHPGGRLTGSEGAGGFDFFGFCFAVEVRPLFSEPDLAVDRRGAAAFGGTLDAVIAGDDRQSARRVAGGDQFFKEFVGVAMVAGEVDFDALIFVRIRKAGWGFGGVVHDGNGFIFGAIDLRSQKLEQPGSHPLERAAASARLDAGSEDQVVAVDKEGHFVLGI